jgi:Flp pilus assembly protein TadD
MRVPSTILIVTALLVTVAGAQNTGKTVRHHRVIEQSPVTTAINNAEAAIEKEDYDTAEKLLREAIAGDSKEYRAWFDLGFVLNAKGQTADAIDAYRKSVAANPGIFESNLNLGLVLAKNGDAEAEKYLRAATQLKPTSHPREGVYRAWLSLGHVLEKTDPKRAVEAFKAAATLEPKNAEAHLSAAMAYENLKQFAAAEAEYKTAAELDPKSAEALAGLVNVYQKNGRLEEAESPLRKYIALDPRNATAHVQLGRVLAGTGKYEEAATELQTGLKLAPGDPVATRELAELLIQQKKYAEAEALLRPLVASSPGDAALHYELGRVLMRKHDFAGAENEILAALKLKNDMGEAYGDLAVVANENRQYVLVLRALDARAKFLADTPGTYFLRATTYDNLRVPKEAIANYHLFLQAANGQFPEEEWKARHRLIALEPKKK